MMQKQRGNYHEWKDGRKDRGVPKLQSGMDTLYHIIGVI
jgi:hypothetical protein